MGRKAPEPVDPTRRLAEVDPVTGATGKLWNGAIYVRGMEDQLPEDFPQDGPHWEDWEDDGPRDTGVSGFTALQMQQDAEAAAEAKAAADAASQEPRGPRGSRKNRGSTSKRGSSAH